MKLYDALIGKEEKLSVIGLGYVGMPIAVAFAKKINIIGFDLDTKKSISIKAALIQLMKWVTKLLLRQQSSLLLMSLASAKLSFILLQLPRL